MTLYSPAFDRQFELAAVPLEKAVDDVEHERVVEVGRILERFDRSCSPGPSSGQKA